MDLELLTLPRSREEWNEWIQHTLERFRANPSRLKFWTLAGSTILPVESGGLRHFSRSVSNSVTIALCGRAVTPDTLQVERTCQTCSDQASALKVA